ncbi:hypothetical protein CFC21_085028 [Triticum aestivum]|uniref:Uncharacterized protein n=2 Tax=Triticum aestivum TaxID=4565 RepID=A0A9R1ICE8_WHEAT|nr:hypothetical protein CFC21_085028 [Triticum aestivum]
MEAAPVGVVEMDAMTHPTASYEPSITELQTAEWQDAPAEGEGALLESTINFIVTNMETSWNRPTILVEPAWRRVGTDQQFGCDAKDCWDQHVN